MGKAGETQGGSREIVVGREGHVRIWQAKYDVELTRQSTDNAQARPARQTSGTSVHLSPLTLPSQSQAAQSQITSESSSVLVSFLD